MLKLRSVNFLSVHECDDDDDDDDDDDVYSLHIKLTVAHIM